ncbi:MAG: VCBS repeat-containing protein [Thermodesulfobacteriota bacterium]
MLGHGSRTFFRSMWVLLLSGTCLWAGTACAIDGKPRHRGYPAIAAATADGASRERSSAKGGDASSSRGSSQSEALWKSQELSLPAVGMSAGDIDGDGQNELVIIGPSHVYAYRIEGTGLTPLAELDLSPLELKSVDVAKIAKSGPARIYVSAQNRGALSSQVIELRGGKLETVIKDVRHYLRVIEYPTRGPFLLGQTRGMKRFYEGPIFRLSDTGTALQQTGRFGVPLKIPIFGFAIGDLEGNLQPLIAAYDRQDHLRIYNPKGQRLFRSGAYYGGSDVLLRPMNTDRRTDEHTLETTSDTEYFRPRIMSLDLRQDGKYEILVVCHESKTGRYLSRTRMLEDGQVQGLVWNGDATEERWSSPKIQGTMVDFAVTNLPGMSGLRLVTVERKKTDWLSLIRSRSQVRAYDLRRLMEKGPQSGRRDE